jgi:hypothetical protein
MASALVLASKRTPLATDFARVEVDVGKAKLSFWDKPVIFMFPVFLRVLIGKHPTNDFLPQKLLKTCGR